MKKIKISIDKNKCIGSASCVVLAPKNFDLGDDGKSIAITQVVSTDLETVKKAAISCPVGAISLQEIL